MNIPITGGRQDGGDDADSREDDMDADAKKQEAPTPDRRQPPGPVPGAKKQEI